MRAPHEHRRGWQIWARIAFPVSLVLNIFLIAVIAGHVLHRRAQREESSAPLLQVPLLQQALRNAEAILSTSDSAAFGATVRRDEPQFLPAAVNLRHAREELEKKIIADPFDEAAVKQALAAFRISSDQFWDAFDGTLVEALSKVSPEGRKKLVVERQKAVTGIRPD